MNAQDSATLPTFHPAVKVARLSVSVQVWGILMVNAVAGNFIAQFLVIVMRMRALL